MVIRILYGPPKYSVDYYVGARDNWFEGKFDENQLCDCFRSMSLNNTPYVYVKGGDIEIHFRKGKDTFLVRVVERLFLAALDIILSMPLDGVNIFGNISKLKPIDAKAKIGAIHLLEFSQISQAPFLSSLSENSFLTELSIREVSDENFATLTKCLMSNRAIKVLTVQKFSDKIEENLIELLIHQCYLKTLTLENVVSSTLIYAILRYATSLKEFSMFWQGCPPQWVWDDLRVNSTLQVLKVNDISNPEGEVVKAERVNRQVAELQENRVLRKVFVNKVDLESYVFAHESTELLLRNRIYTGIRPEEHKPSVRVLDGFREEELEGWAQSEDAKDVRKLVVIRMDNSKLDRCNFFSN